MENVPDPRVLMDCINRLERRNRQLSWALLGLAALTFAGLTGVTAASSRTTPAVVTASQFILTAGDGSKRGELIVGSDGGGHIVLYGPDGQAVAELPMRTQAFPLKH